MNKLDTHCAQCNKDFICRKDLTDHNSYMRRTDKSEGHEIKETQSVRAFSKAGSVLGTKVVKMENINVASKNFF